MLPLGFLVSVLPLFHVRRQSDIRLFGVLLRVRLRHSRGSGARNPRGGGGTERDGALALTLIVARRDHKYIITVPFNHFCIHIFSRRVAISHRPVFTHAFITVHAYILYYREINRLV